MTRLQWGIPGSKLYETGVDRGVLYVGAQDGVAWNGLISVSESPDGGQPKEYFLDGVNHLTIGTRNKFKANIQAFYSPHEFDVCDGSVEIYSGLSVSEQRRKPFGMTYRTKIGNDLQGTDHGYKIHLLYNAFASPTQINYSTLSADTENSTLSWDVVTRPVRLEGLAPTSHMVIDSTRIDANLLEIIENILYGGTNGPPRLPTPEELIDVFVLDYDLTVVDHGDGSFSVTGPDEKVTSIDAETYQLNSTAVHEVDNESFTVHYP